MESKVTVFKAGTQEILGYDEVRTDFCYRSKRSATLHFGLGSVDCIDVEVVTRDGRRKRFEAVTVDERCTLEMASP